MKTLFFSDFKDALVHCEDAIKEADFLAVDTEFTGSNL